MMDLTGELKHLLRLFQERDIDYALCGGLALAVHGVVRATIDIDLLILTDDLDRALEAAKKAGFSFSAGPMSFAEGKVLIRRVTKVDPDSGDHLPLDLLLVTEPLRAIWNDRTTISWEDLELTVLTKQGLIALKTLRLSPQDLEDIKRLQETAP